MFTFDDATRLMWFNGSSLEPNVQFELVGIVRAPALPAGCPVSPCANTDDRCRVSHSYSGLRFTTRSFWT